MQKSSFFSLIRESFIRGIVFGVSACAVIGLILISVSYAASNSGGIFGEILDTILASSDWQNPGDGTVKNTLKLGGIEANQYVKITPNQSYPTNTNQCIYSINADGTLLCR